MYVRLLVLLKFVHVQMIAYAAVKRIRGGVLRAGAPSLCMCMYVRGCVGAWVRGCVGAWVRVCARVHFFSIFSLMPRLRSLDLDLRRQDCEHQTAVGDEREEGAAQIHSISLEYW